MMIMVKTGHKSISQMRNKLKKMREDIEELEYCIQSCEEKEDYSRGREREREYDGYDRERSRYDEREYRGRY